MDNLPKPLNRANRYGDQGDAHNILTLGALIIIPY